MRAPSASRRSRQATQRGIVMWIALVVLIVMTLAGLAMLRQMGSGVSIAGNLAFKENATSVADSGTEVARQWLLAAPGAGIDLNVDHLASGYSATWGASVDPATYFVPGPLVPVPVALDVGTGNNVLYVLQRLCQNTGPITDVTQRCSNLEDPAGGSNEGLSYGAAPPAARFRAYYRVTVQVLGPRNTVSYTQVVLR